MRGALGVYGNRPNLAPVDQFADVEVADFRVARRAAKFGLAVQPLLRFKREVEGVVLGYCGEDAMREPARGRPVDALRRGDQLRAGFHDLEQQVRVVAAVAGETIDFVNYHVGRGIAGADAPQQAFHSGAMGVGRRLGRIGELSGYLRFKLRGFSLAVGPLRLD
ncbi:MAG TPA: hypothetical protein VI039_01295 [Solirubrobacterales bacterium]